MAARVIRPQLLAAEAKLQAEPRYQIYNGVYTLTGPKGYRTYRVATVQSGNLEGKRILSVLNGPDNTEDFYGIGFVSSSLDGDDYVYVWRKHHGTQWEILAKAFEKILRDGINGYSVLASSTCLRCNRRLTVPTSIHAGYGPECVNK